MTAESALDTDVSRNPADYAPTDHFVIRARRDSGPASETRTDPPITSEVTRKCIAEGEIEDAQGDRVKFVAMVEGVEWHLIVEDGLVLTAYAEGRHEPAPGVVEVEA